MSIILQKIEKTTTLADLQKSLQQVEDAGDLLVSLSTGTLSDGTDANVAAFSQGAAIPPLGALELFTEPVGMTAAREAAFFNTLETDGSRFIAVCDTFIQGALSRVVICRAPVPKPAVPAQGIPAAVSGNGASTPVNRAVPSPADGDSSGLRDQILQIAADSDIARYDWPDRGRAPIGYTKGMALVFGQVYRKLKNQDPMAMEMAKAATGNPDRDALTWYQDKFAAAGMDNSVPGPDTLRHLFVLLTGLGMRESSGKYCEGRDAHAHNTSAETAEAGPFQTSYNARNGSPLMEALFERYRQNPVPSYLDVFQERASCHAADAENFGEGLGKEFQQLSKECPAFAAEFAALGLRSIRTHWGPINSGKVEIRRACDDMFKRVQGAVDASSSPAVLT